ncbi:MAG: hypothetical protein WDN03_02780 [Rhizomicrobium sp.]
MLRNAALLIGLTFAAPACAAGLVMPGATPETYQAYETQAVSQPWSSQQPNARLVERPIGEIIATRLGIAKGSAELFRYHPGERAFRPHPDLRPGGRRRHQAEAVLVALRALSDWRMGTPHSAGIKHDL